MYTIPKRVQPHQLNPINCLPNPIHNRHMYECVIREVKSGLRMENDAKGLNIIEPAIVTITLSYNRRETLLKCFKVKMENDSFSFMAL